MKFYCAYCGYGIESDSGSFGKDVTCPSCRAEIQVPQLQETSQFEVSQSPKTKSVPSMPGSTWGRKIRRVFLLSLLGCFVVGAATAIIAILSSNLNEIQAKIILTTFSLGVYSLCAICCALLAEKRQFRIFGSLGIAASIAGGLFVILTNWGVVKGLEIFIIGRFSFLIVAIAFAHAALLLMINTTNSMVRTLRIITLGIISLVAVLLLGTTLNLASIVSTWVILCVLGVADLLGTIATLVLHLATRRTSSG
jgi:hypothetical protein